MCSKVFITGSPNIKFDLDISTLRARYKRIEEMCAQKYLSRDPPISKLTTILDWEADSMSTGKKYYSHKEGRNDMDD